MLTPTDNTFGRPIIPATEPARLAALTRYVNGVLPPAAAFNHIAQMAARMFDVPIALVNLVGADDAEAVGAAGAIPVGNRVARGTSLCSLAILNDTPTVFADALAEPCLLANPMVTGELGLRFYAAAPLTTPDGHHIGAICLVDQHPRTFTASDQKVLEGLAQIIMEDMETRFRYGNVEADRQ